MLAVELEIEYCVFWPEQGYVCKDTQARICVFKNIQSIYTGGIDRAIDAVSESTHLSQAELPEPLVITHGHASIALELSLRISGHQMASVVARAAARVLEPKDAADLSVSATQSAGFR